MRGAVSSEEEEPVAELPAWLPVKVLTDLVGELKVPKLEMIGLKTGETNLVSVLTRGRHPHSARPVEVHVGQLVTSRERH